MRPRIRRSEGFRDQVLHVIPKDLIGSARSVPFLHDFFITDIGRYPDANGHFHERRNGAAEHILIICEAGSGTVSINGIELAVEPRQFVVIPHGSSHQYYAATNDPWTISWCHFHGSRSDTFSYIIDDKARVLPINDALLHRIAGLFEIAFDIVRRGYTIEHLTAASSVVYTVLSLLSFDNDALLSMSESVSNRYLANAFDYVDANIYKSISLHDIASNTGISISRLTQLFCSLVGVSPMQYVTRERIYKACYYLTATNEKIYVIAENMGYGDPFYFSRVFKKIMGVSPHRYRQGKAIYRPIAERKIE